MKSAVKLKKLFLNNKTLQGWQKWGKGNWKLNFLCLLSKEFLDYSYFETKLFQFRNRSEERGIDWS